MVRYVVHKVLHTALVAFGVVTLVFAALRLSGDPAATMLPGEASVDELAALRHELGLDQPVHIQYVRFLAGAVTGDFGMSLRHQEPALRLVMERLPATLELAFAALVLAVVVALPLGIVAAIYRGRLADMLAMAFAVVGQATPYFWMGIMLILIFAVELEWLPTSGRGGFDRLILPAVTLGTHFMAVLARLTRTSMLEVLGQNYVTTARAKGLSEWVVILTHVLKNAAVPVVTLIGLQFGTLLGGAVVTETIFAWPGVGRLAVQSIFVRDYPVVQAGVFVLALSFVGINLLVDLLYGFLDPRIRSEEEAPASTPSSRGRRRVAWALIVPAVPVAIAIGVAIFAPFVAPQSPTAGRLAARLTPPAWQEGGTIARVLGTDVLGRDVLSRLIWGARISLLIALLATLLGTTVGSLIGLVTGYYRGRVDRVVTKLIDIQLAFPFVLLAIAVIAVAGPSVPVLVIVLAIGSWVGHARIVRGLVLSLRERDYVQAARALGAGTPRVLFRHLVPEILSLILVMATFDVGRIIILESTLSFLGLGVQPPTPSWGSDLRDAAIYVRQAWWMATFPGLAIMLVVLGVNLLGDALRDVLDPRTQKKGGRR